MVIKIAISGKMCSGKSFCAKMIQQKHAQFKICSFAEKLKSVTHDLFFDKFIGESGNENTIQQMHKNRGLYVDVGQRMREIDKNIWVNHLVRDSLNKSYVVVDDLRFKNELFALQKEGWKIVRVNISREEQINRLKDIYVNWEDHVAGLDAIPETDLDDVVDDTFDFIAEGDNVGEKVLKWVDDEIKNSSNDNDDSNTGYHDVDFESYIKDNGVIC
jgi:hypothetical protein